MAKTVKKDSVVDMSSGLRSLHKMSFDSAKRLAFDYSSSTYREIAQQTKLGLSNVKRMLGEDGYHPSSQYIPDLCDALGNYIMIEWMAAQVGFKLVKIQSEPSCSDLGASAASTVNEAAGVLAAYSEMMRDGKITPDELKALIKETSELLHEAHRTLEVAKTMLGDIDA